MSLLRDQKYLKQIIQYTGASDCDMEKGNLRVDLNISMRPFGQKEFGVRREVKNLNSFSIDSISTSSK